jgi:hypothetical protein
LPEITGGSPNPAEKYRMEQRFEKEKKDREMRTLIK